MKKDLQLIVEQIYFEFCCLKEILNRYEYNANYMERVITCFNRVLLNSRSKSKNCKRVNCVIKNRW